MKYKYRDLEFENESALIAYFSSFSQDNNEFQYMLRASRWIDMYHNEKMDTSSVEKYVEQLVEMGIVQKIC